MNNQSQKKKSSVLKVPHPPIQKLYLGLGPLGSLDVRTSNDGVSPPHFLLSPHLNYSPVFLTGLRKILSSGSPFLPLFEIESG